jgi:anti-sigma factor RsiW
MSENGNKVNGKRDKNAPVLPPQCEEVQGVLFDYMSRELGDMRSQFVREHLRKCDACRREAADLQRTFDALKQASRIPLKVPSRLSMSRRARLVRAVTNPAMEWITAHHALVSIVAAAVALCAALWFVRHLHVERDSDVEPGPAVIIAPRHGPTETNRTDGSGPAGESR